MRHFLPFLLFASSLCGQTLVQAPQGSKATTNTVSQTLSNEGVGHLNLVGISYCENGCAVNPQNDTLAVTTSNSDACAELKSAQVGNQASAIWNCPVSGSITTVTATVTGFKAGDTVHVAISVSEWTGLPPIFGIATGGACTPGVGFLTANPFNGSSLTFYGSGTPSCNPSPAGGILFTVPPAPPPPQSVNFTFSGQVLINGIPMTGTLSIYQIPATGAMNQIAYLIPDANGNVSGTMALSTNFQDMVSLIGYNYDVNNKPVNAGGPPPFPGALLQPNGQLLHGISGVILNLICTQPKDGNGNPIPGAVPICVSGAGTNYGVTN